MTSHERPQHDDTRTLFERIQGVVNVAEGAEQLTGVDCRGANQSRQTLLRHYCAVEERTEVRHFRFAVDLHSEQTGRQGRDDDDDVSKLRGDDATSVVASVFRPDDLHLVVAKVTQLKKNIIFLLALTVIFQLGKLESGERLPF